jgi:branched-subunit amino acid ABC-type transport system permease component
MIQVIFNGLVQGLCLALVGVGFSLVYATTRRVMFVTLGAIFSLSPYILLQCSKLGFPLVIGIVMAVALPSLVSMACEALVHWPLEKKWSSPEANFIGSLGCYLIVEQMIALAWGTDAHVFIQGADKIYPFQNLRVSSSQIVTICSTLAVLTAAVLVPKAAIGLKIRALSSNSKLLSVIGTDVKRLRRMIFFVAGSLAAISGLLRANEFGFSPYTGMTAVLIGLVATVVGGRGSFAGAAVAAVALGILRELTAFNLSAALVEATPFLALVFTLLLFPNGIRGILLGKTRPEET